MDLLTAVNRILPKLGEGPVTSLTSRSPTLAVLLPMFEAQNRELTKQGWWFNTHRTTLAPSSTGEITVASEVMSFVADDAVCSIRNKRLHDSENNTFVWTRGVSGTMITYVPFEELPESVADLVFYSVAVEACVTDVGVTQEAQVWQSAIGPALNRATSEHLRNMRYSTQKSRRYKNLRRAQRG